MLRSGVIAIGALALVGGLVTMVTGIFPPAFVCLFWGALILLGTVWEKVLYKPLEENRPGPGWVATEERFVDDATGKLVRVWTEPASGERRYVTD